MDATIHGTQHPTVAPPAAGATGQVPVVDRVVRTPDGARLAVAAHGDLDARARPLAVLVHGFPDTPATWRHLGPALVAAGYRVAAPWLRGWWPSAGGDGPCLARYAQDVCTVVDALGGDGRTVLVGHDWGSLAVQHAAAAADAAAVVAIAVPPEPALAGMLLDLDQLVRSSYFVRNALPATPAWCRDDLRPVVRLWRRWSPGYVPTAADLAPLRAALPDRAAADRTLAPYRAALPGVLAQRWPSPDGPVPPCPTMVVHGRDDGCIHVRYAVAAGPHLAAVDARSTVWTVPEAGHWVHLERPDDVGQGVVAFLARTAGAT